MLSFKKGFMEEFNIPHTNYLITTIGRLEPPKGHINLLKATPLVLNRFPETTFLIIGDGSLRDQLEELAQRLGIKRNIVFTGFRNDINNILYISDLCVVPSNREGFSITVLESMSVGRPIIATDVGGNAEAIVNGESGVIIQSHHPIALADSVITLLKNKKIAEEMAINARKRFEEFFTLDKVIGETMQLYESLCCKFK